MAKSSSKATRLLSGRLFDFVVARYNVDGSLDTGFGSGGRVLTDFAGRGDLAGGGDFATQIAVQTDGKLVVAGNVVVSSPQHVDFGLVRYNADGSLDTTFGANGKTATDFANNNDHVWGLALQRDGRILVGGETYDPSSTSTLSSLDMTLTEVSTAALAMGAGYSEISSQNGTRFTLSPFSPTTR